MTTRNSVTSRRTEQQSSNGGDNFKVAVRVRPLIEREIKSGTRVSSQWLISEGGGGVSGRLHRTPC